METSNKITPFVAVAPGATIKEELVARGIKQKEFAALIGMQTTHFSELVNGKRDITPAIADKLEIQLGIPAKFWVRLQAEYDYDRQVIMQRDIEEQKAQLLIAEYNQKIDVNLLLRKVNSKASTFTEKLAVLTDVFRLPKPAVLIYEQGRFHKSDKVGTDERAILTWTILARHAATQQNVNGKYDAEDNTLVDQLASVLNSNSGNVIQLVTDIMANHGIRFCVEKKIPNASVDGYSFIAADGVPSVVVTMRFNRIDNLAFAIMHEIGHLKLHFDGTKTSFINISEDTKEENEANKFASSVLVPDHIWRSRPKVAVNPRNIQTEYGKWAEQNGLNRWVVLGRIAHETGMYKFTQDNTRLVSGYVE